MSRLLLLLAVSAASAAAGDPARGFELLRTKGYLPADFDEGTLDALWTNWPEPGRSAAEAATTEDRRAMTLARYGLHAPPGRPDGLAGYVATDRGFAMSCFACHAGSVAGGETVWGLPNAHTALHSLTDDVLATKLRQLKLPSHMDVGSRYIPLNQTDGTTNAVIFGVALGAGRDADMNVTDGREPNVVHHDMDAPPWWNVRKKRMLYLDGFAPKTARVLMQFMMLPANDGPTFRGWEADYEDVLAYIESCEPPAWPWAVDLELAERGREAFEANCSQCHGTYGEAETYPEVLVPIEEIGTDRVRLDALTVGHRGRMKAGWMSRYGADPVVEDPGGYVAPPLDGIWASAPYLHNGSVPTLWHLLHGRERLSVWRRTRDGYDQERVGLEFETIDAVPSDASEAERRSYRDSSRVGMSNAGHDYPELLSESEKRAVLEYLKIL